MNEPYCRMTCAPVHGTELLRVVLTFDRAELLYDIKNYAYIEGDVLGEEKQHGQHVLVDIGEDGNVDRVTRVLNVVHAAVVAMLYPLTKEEAIAECIGDELTEPEAYVINLLVPKEAPRASIQLLSHLVHEYMVYRVLHDWLSVTNEAAAARWLEKSELAEREIRRMRYFRDRVFTRGMHPF